MLLKIFIRRKETYKIYVNDVCASACIIAWTQYAENGWAREHSAGRLGKFRGT